MTDVTNTINGNVYLVTGGAGFIGSNFIRYLLDAEPSAFVINLDLLTYAGNLANLAEIESHPNYRFVKGDIRDETFVGRVMAGEFSDDRAPNIVVNFAAESHVDRSIIGPGVFVDTNVKGTLVLLEAARAAWLTAFSYNDVETCKREPAQSRFRYLQVSTDEVYGTLGPTGLFTEATPLAPNSPYSASKASADLLVRSYHETFGLPVLTTRCSNNYGPYQFPEKLIPLVFMRAVSGGEIPVYGDGLNVRDWIYVEDHCRAIHATLAKGRVGEVYNIGATSERTNIHIVKTILSAVERLKGKPTGALDNLIRYVKDRPGHDRRYAIDSTKTKTELGWAPLRSFEENIETTIAWYLDHQAWLDGVTSGSYQSYFNLNYAARLH